MLTIYLFIANYSLHIAMLYQLRNLQHRYGDRTVLELPALDIQRGEILSIVGPSGSGKSTLLRLLQFLEKPTSGSITFDGLSIDQPSLEVRRRVATVFQRPMLLDRSVRANVAFGLQLRRAQGIDRVVDQALERVGLLKVAHAKAHTLSGGEAQRVALARAIVLQPDALLLDEPTANLDPYNVGLIENLIHDHDRLTVVLVTHNIFQAKRLADRIGLLINGQLIELAQADQFFDTPIDPRTRSFINGEMVY
jgi:tungstate transport system ATP-binding protein